MVGASVGGHNENVALHEGVRFNLNDTIIGNIEKNDKNVCSLEN